MTRLEVAPSLDLDASLVSKVVAILAQRGAGKTATAKVIAEELTALGQPWVALDPTGAWFGLRSSVDGQKPGLPVVIFGGEHGDIPLAPDSGTEVATLIVDSPGWYVLDLSGFDSKAEERRFATAFATRLYRAKAQQKAPLHLFIDEADLFIPQQSPAGDKTMLGAFEQLVRRGRSRGLGVTLISQRAAVLNKNVLEMLDVLIALRTTGMRDRDTMKAYMAVSGTAAQMVEMSETLPGLRLGEAWVWEPGRLPPTFGRFQVRRLRTFDSSSTPEAGGVRVDPAAFAQVDLDVVKERMAAAIDRARADDPVLLHRRIAELERQVGRPVEVEVEVEVVPVGVREALLDTIGLYERSGEALVQLTEAFTGSIETALTGLRGEVDRLPARTRATPRNSVADRAALSARDGSDQPLRDRSRRPAGRNTVERRGSTRATAAADSATFSAGEQRICTVLWRDGPCTTLHVARCAIYARNGGGFRTAWKRLTDLGYIEAGALPGEHALTADPASFAALVELPDPLEAWCAHPKMDGGAQRILRYLADEWPAERTPGEIAAALGYAASGGGFRTAMKRVRTFELLDGQAIARELRSA